MLERSIEDRFVKLVVDDGFEVIKGSGKVGWPDREVFLNNGHMFFIEFKRPGKKPTKIQRFRIATLKRLGHHAFWTDSYEEAVKIYEEEKIFANRLSKKSRTERDKEPSLWPVSSSRTWEDGDHS